MINQVVIISDSFKESIDSKTIGKIGNELISHFVPVKCYSIADGGEGTVDFYINELGYQKAFIESVNAFGDVITTYYAYHNDTAVFDVAQIVGFKINQRLAIRKATTYGIGLVLDALLKKGFKEIILGLGGSITNDGGASMLEALGAKFSYQGKAINLTKEPFSLVDHVDLSIVLKKMAHINFTVLADVTNPLLGENGATYVFSKQKGATNADQVFLEDWMQKYSKCFTIDCNANSSGAAGGLGFATTAIGAKVLPGIDVLLAKCGFRDYLKQDTLVITGEGKIDKTSFQGKVISKIYQETKKYDAQIAFICGISECLDSNLLIYPLHNEPILNFKETVEADLKMVFKKIIKDLIIDENRIHIVQVPYFDSKYRMLRKEVFVDEQGVDESIEFEGEEDAMHYTLLYNDSLCGAFRLKKEEDKMYLQRFLIKKEYRALSFGKRMMDEALKIIKAMNISTVYLHAQLQALIFYQKCGFTSFGDTFMEANIPHIQMKKDLK